MSNGDGATSGALDGLRVVDFGQYLAGPFLTMMLADNGADVIHIDPPDGPTWDHPANVALMRNKRAIRLDLKTEVGLSTARHLVQSADVVVENFRPGTMERLCLSPTATAEVNPRLIWCSLPGFGSSDPRAGVRAWEGVVCSAADMYTPEHFFAGDPVFHALPLASNFAAFLGAHRVAAALIARLRTGRGQQFEVPLFDACFQAIGLFAEMPMSRDTFTRYATDAFFARISQLTRPRKTSDGSYLYLDTPARGLQALLDRFLPGYDLLNLDDARFDQLMSDIEQLIATKPGAEWERICQEQLGASAGLVQSTEEWLHDDHAMSSGAVVEVDDPSVGRSHQVGFPVVLDKTPSRVRWPRGANDPTVSESIDWLGPVRDDPPLEPTAAGLPLDGFTVLDCCTLLAGPTMSRILAQYGADVVKVDRTGLATGDMSLLTDDSGAFLGGRTVNSGKRMVFLDLKDATAQDVVHRLVTSSDVVHHNFTPGAARRLGLSQEVIAQLNPAAIQSTMSLHSHGGFRAEYRGHDMTAQMSTGMSKRMGGADTPRTMAVVINDNAAGHLNAFGVLLALLHRNRTGEAQSVNSSLSTTATMHQFPFMVGYEGRVWDEPAGRGVYGWGALDRLYRAKDGWIYVADLRANGLETLATVPWCDGVLDVPTGQLENWLEERICQRNAEHSVADLVAAGIGAHRYVSLADLLDDEQVQSRGLTSVVEHPGLGRALGIGSPVFDVHGGTGPEVAARRPGGDTIDVLTELGFSAQIPDLICRRIIAVGENPIVRATTAPGYWTTEPLTPLFTAERRRELAQWVVGMTPSPAWPGPARITERNQSVTPAEPASVPANV